jgi:pyruvate dehydrogenase E2 component (dihydrolipoamide acetyltransferase)
MADVAKVQMPKWGLSMTSGKITEWIVSEGDEVAKGDDLAEIDTDKIAGALEASDPGIVRRIIADVGEDVPVGATIALIAAADVPDEEIDTLAREAREALDSGAVEQVPGPETGKVTVDGRDIAYAVVGTEGPDVVLVHGFGGDKNSWLFVQEPLSADHVVHALDLPGHGESAKDVGDGSLDLLAGAVVGYLAERGIDKAHLVGHSLGGAVVVTAAATAPDRVASVTLVAPAGFGSQINAGYLRGFTEATSRRELKPHLEALFADPALATRQLADDLMKYKRLDGVTEALTALLATMLDGDAPAIDVSSALAGLDVPVAVVWGKADAVLPAGNSTALPDGTNVQEVERAGHMVHMENPSSVVAAVRSVAGA